MLCAPLNALAIDFEKMVMPGEVIAGHADIEGECSECHLAFARERQNELCLNCHQPVAADIVAGRGFHGRSPDASGAPCVDCHTEHQGRDADIAAFDARAFDHLLTDFHLLGKHGDVACDDCHAPGSLFRDAPRACIDCHRDDDVHRGELGTECSSCHVPDDWLQVTFDHLVETGFALQFGHAGLACEACHDDQRFANAPATCIGCHRDDDAHAGLLGDDCAACHDERRWTSNAFRHDRFTGFALLGGHATLACSDCHSVAVTTANPGTTCIDCHRDDDPHEGELGEDCVACHNESSWLSDIRFDHEFTVFPLLGRHSEAACADCHATALFTDTSQVCSDCHANDDVHKGMLGSDCAACHTPADWSLWRFDHLVTTGFSLDGAHEPLACVDCHTEPAAPGRRTPSRCIDCHRNDDVHDGAFGRDCGRCHTTRTFRGARQP